MPAKITLVTPPDIFQNEQPSVMFVDLSEDEQDFVSVWLGKADLSLNIYYYQGEPNVPWFLHAMTCATHKYINLDRMSPTTTYLVGYLLSKPGVCYTTKDENVAEVYSHINLNRVDNVIEFLERALNGKE